LSFVILATAFSVPAHVQKHPSQPIRFIVPFTPGTGMDIIARTVAPNLSQRLGEPVVVDNRPGASGNIGAEAVAKSPPDGVMVSANTMVITPSLYQSVPYDPVRDFAPISLAAWGTLAFVTNPGKNIDKVADLVAQAKAQPGRLTYGSPAMMERDHARWARLMKKNNIKAE
jgi:tripartite-type tricarboxylate transporter receptor subunit TctC